MKPYQTVVLVITINPETTSYDRGYLSRWVTDLVRNIPGKLAQDILVYETTISELVNLYHKEILKEKVP